MNLYDLAIAKKLAGGGGGGGGGLEYETGEWLPPDKTTNRAFIPFAKTHAKLPAIVIIALAQTAADYWSNNRVTAFEYYDFYQLWNKGFNINKTDGFGYSLIKTAKWSSDRVSFEGVVLTSHNSDSSGDTDNTYPRYFVNESGFYIDANPDTFNGRTFPKPNDDNFKWIAIWV